MHDVEVSRAPGGLGPVDHSGYSIAFPQDVSGVKITVDQPSMRRWWTLVEDVDRASPELGSRRPAGHLKIIRRPELKLAGAKVIIYRRAVNDHGDLRQLVDRMHD